MGLVDVVARGDLCYLEGRVRRRFMPSAFDREVLRLADAVVASRCPAGLVLPLPSTRVSTVLAAAILVADYARTSRPTARVALASRNLSLRRFYGSLCIQDNRLADYFAEQLVLPGGRTLPLYGPAPALAGYPGRLHIMPDLSRIASAAGGYLGLIAEDGATDPTSFRNLLNRHAGHVPMVYVTTNPRDPLIDHLADAGAVWAWAPEEVGELADRDKGRTVRPICASVEALSGAAETAFDVSGPGESASLDLALMRIWEDLAELQHGGVSHEHQIGWAWGVFSALSQLTVPVEYYDRHARAAWRTASLATAPARAAAFADTAAGSRMREFWLVLAADLQDAVDAAGRNPKPLDLAGRIEQLCERGAAGVVVVRNRAAVAATAEYLAEQTSLPRSWPDHVQVCTFGVLAGAPAEPTMPVILCGPVPGRFAGLLATPSAGQLTVLSHGPWETGRIIRQIRGVNRRLRELASGPLRARARQRLYRLDGPPVSLSKAEPHITHSPADLPRAPRLARAPVWSPFSIAAISEKLARTDTGEGTAAESDAGRVITFMITFENGVGFFDPLRRISKLSDDGERDVAVKSLQPGDRVILVDRGIRDSLFDLVTDKLERLPEFGAVATLVRQWQERAVLGFQRSGQTYGELLGGMRGLGSGVTTAAAISHWIGRRVEGPHDPEDIRRLGQILRDEVLVRDWEAIGKALSMLRTHRRKVGRMLAAVIHGLAWEDMEEDGYFDRRLGLHISDLAAAVSVHTVAAIGAEPVSVAAYEANVLLDNTHAARILAGRKEAA